LIKIGSLSFFVLFIFATSTQRNDTFCNETSISAICGNFTETFHVEKDFVWITGFGSLGFDIACSEDGLIEVEAEVWADTGLSNFPSLYVEVGEAEKEWHFSPSTTFTWQTVFSSALVKSGNATLQFWPESSTRIRSVRITNVHAASHCHFLDCCIQTMSPSSSPSSSPILDLCECIGLVDDIIKDPLTYQEVHDLRALDFGAYCNRWDLETFSPWNAQCQDGEFCGERNWCIREFCYVNESCPLPHDESDRFPGNYYSYEVCGYSNCFVHDISCFVNETVCPLGCERSNSTNVCEVIDFEGIVFPSVRPSHGPTEDNGLACHQIDSCVGILEETCERFRDQQDCISTPWCDWKHCNTAAQYSLGNCYPQNGSHVYEESQCCPSGYVQIHTLQDCEHAFDYLDVKNVTWGGIESFSYKPSGCIINRANWTMFFNNMNTTGVKIRGLSEVINLCVVEKDIIKLIVTIQAYPDDVTQELLDSICGSIASGLKGNVTRCQLQENASRRILQDLNEYSIHLDVSSDDVESAEIMVETEDFVDSIDSAIPGNVAILYILHREDMPTFSPTLMPFVLPVCPQDVRDIVIGTIHEFEGCQGVSTVADNGLSALQCSCILQTDAVDYELTVAQLNGCKFFEDLEYSLMGLWLHCNQTFTKNIPSSAPTLAVFGIDYYYVHIGKGFCSDWVYLPIGSYPDYLTPQDPLYDADRLRECMNRCLESSHLGALGYVGEHTRNISSDAFYVLMPSQKCGCSSGICKTQKPSSGFESYRIFQSECNPDFVDSEGFNCQAYNRSYWCTSTGTYGHGWTQDRGTFEDYSVNNQSAFVCPQCGCTETWWPTQSEMNGGQDRYSLLEDIFGSDHWSTKFFAMSILVILILWSIMMMYISREPYLEFSEKWQSVKNWTRCAFSLFDFLSDISFIMWVSSNDSLFYFYAMTIIFCVCCFKNLALVAHRAPILMDEELVGSWKSKQPGGFLVLPLLFILSGFSPVYYDLLLTAEVMFPIFPPKRRFLPLEKLIQVITENVFSITIAAMYLVNEGSSQVLALISLSSSIFMTFVLLFAGGCEVFHTQHLSRKRATNVHVTLRGEDMETPPNRSMLKKQIQMHLGPSCIVDVWYVCQIKSNYEVYIFIQTQDNTLVLSHEDIRKFIEMAVDFLELPTRKSIEVSSHTKRSTALQMVRFENTNSANYTTFGDIGNVSPSTSGGGAIPSSRKRRKVEYHFISQTRPSIDAFLDFTKTPTTGSMEGVYVSNFDDTPDVSGSPLVLGNSLVTNSRRNTMINQQVTFLDATDIILDFKRVIGKGNFAEIYVGYFRGAKTAFKRSQGIENYASENALYKKVSDHPNICRYYGIHKFDELQFFLDYYEDGSLLDVILKKRFSDEMKIHFCVELTKGLWHMHSEGVLHGDLALRNVLVDVLNKKVVITDFGMSCRFPCEKQRTVLCPRWASSKLMASRILTKESDIWALAVTFWELFSNGLLPYGNMKGELVVSRLAAGDLSPTCHDSWPITPILHRIFENDEDPRIDVKWLFRKLQGLNDFDETPLVMESMRHLETFSNIEVGK